jgi:hypothetical protein
MGVHERGRKVRAEGTRINVPLDRSGFETDLVSAAAQKQAPGCYDLKGEKGWSFVQDHQVNVVGVRQPDKFGKKGESDLSVSPWGNVLAEEHGEVKV